MASEAWFSSAPLTSALEVALFVHLSNMLFKILCLLCCLERFSPENPSVSVYLCSSSHQDVEYISPFLKTGLVLWLTSTSAMWQKWHSASLGLTFIRPGSLACAFLEASHCVKRSLLSYLETTWREIQENGRTPRTLQCQLSPATQETLAGTTCSWDELT